MSCVNNYTLIRVLASDASRFRYYSQVLEGPVRTCQFSTYIAPTTRPVGGTSGGLSILQPDGSVLGRVAS